MSYNERESRAVLLERLAYELEHSNDFEDFWDQHLPEGTSRKKAIAEWLKAKAGAQRNPVRRRRGDKPVMVRSAHPDEVHTYPPDPHWGVDKHERFVYTDYDGESLIVRSSEEDDGSLWLDKGGEGPVYVRGEDVKVIIEALENVDSV